MKCCMRLLKFIPLTLVLMVAVFAAMLLMGGDTDYKEATFVNSDGGSVE